MLSLAKAILATSILASLSVASPFGKLQTRQGNFVTEPGCAEASGGNLTPETFATLRQVWGEQFPGWGGELEPNPKGGIAGNAWAVCCSGNCLYIENRAARTIGWNLEDFNGAADAINEELGGSSPLCQAPTADDEYLVMSYVAGDLTRNGADLIEIIGDTCEGAPGFKGEMTPA